jgi:hypothetical protein
MAKQKNTTQKFYNICPWWVTSRRVHFGKIAETNLIKWVKTGNPY